MFLIISYKNKYHVQQFRKIIYVKCGPIGYKHRFSTIASFALIKIKSIIYDAFTGCYYSFPGYINVHQFLKYC